MPDAPFLCLPPRVPLALTTLVENRAAAIRADNAGDPLEAAGVPRRFWAPRTVLRVRFLDLPQLTDRVLDAAAAWTDGTGIGFRVVTAGESDLRVTFRGGGNWSALGTEAACPELFPLDGPTMSLSEVPRAASQDRVDRVVRHEFGHAIGLMHEHSSPAAGMPWDRPVVYAALTGPPHHWSRAEVDQQVFATYDSTITNYTRFDPRSVMVYPVPPEWTLDRRRIPENHVLSTLDLAFVREVYPARDPGVTARPVPAS